MKEGVGGEKPKNCDPDIIAVMKSQHLGWLGYVKGRYNGGLLKISGIENLGVEGVWVEPDYNGKIR